MAIYLEHSWHKEFAKYLDSGEYSDFTIKCRDHTWKVHRLIVGATSPYFKRVISGPFKEASECLVDLSDDDPEIVACLILYMYFGQLPYKSAPSVDGQASLTKLLGRPKDEINEITLPQLAALIAAADKYQMPVSLADQYQTAYERRIHGIGCSDDSKNLILEFIASVKIIYQTNPAAGLRGRAITTAQYIMDDLQHEQDFLELMRATPDLMFDLTTKGLRQALWCSCCRKGVGSAPDVAPIKKRKRCHKLWAWIDYGNPQNWTAFECRVCGRRGSCSEVRLGTDVED